ncbi:MAG: WhiB family transcriptional regulator [Actinomycetota bacterium]|nr:WhiB family transcriptional regulator [Actinomycetota bacterium]
MFFSQHAERPEARQRREEEARALCRRCPVLVACREWARMQGEYGFWGGESEEERAAAGFPVALPTGRVARILRDRRANAWQSPPTADDGEPERRVDRFQIRRKRDDRSHCPVDG